MIKSPFILNILDLLLDGDELGLELRNQIPYLTDAEYEYTGVGLFVTFSCDEQIHDFEISHATQSFDGVEIKSPELAVGAYTRVSARNGILDYLEIWSYDGNYPRKELSSYTLIQTWRNSQNRKIEKNNT